MLSDRIKDLPPKEQRRILHVIEILVGDAQEDEEKQLLIRNTKRERYRFGISPALLN